MKTLPSSVSSSLFAAIVLVAASGTVACSGAVADVDDGARSGEGNVATAQSERQVAQAATLVEGARATAHVIGACRGAARSCEGRALASCSVDLGCDAEVTRRDDGTSDGALVFTCVGVPVACSELESEAACGQQLGCSWE